MGELKPCPKCKGKPEPRRVGAWKQYYAFFCSSCNYTPVKYCEAQLTIWEAKRIWNRRVKEVEIDQFNRVEFDTVKEDSDG